MDTLTGELEEFAFDGVGTFYLPGDSDADTYFVDNSDVSEVYITTENVEAMAIYYSISEYEMPEDLNALYEEVIAEMGGLDMQISSRRTPTATATPTSPPKAFTCTWHRSPPTAASASSSTAARGRCGKLRFRLLVFPLGNQLA